VDYNKDGKRTVETKPIGICQDCRRKLFERLLDGGATSVTLPITKSNQVMKMITINRSQFQTVHDKIQALGDTPSTARSNAMWDIMEEAACGC